jgi:hypothetical protein
LRPQSAIPRAKNRDYSSLSSPPCLGSLVFKSEFQNPIPGS